MKTSGPSMFLLFLMMVLPSGLKAQTEPDSIFNAVFDSTEDLTPRGDRPVYRDTTKNWSFGGNVSLYISKSSFVNWAAGGQNSFSLNSSGELYTIYEKGKSVWLNDLRMAYGIHKQVTGAGVLLEF